jgi:glycosyltransferase involved in cell wall biosynthesis
MHPLHENTGMHVMHLIGSLRIGGAEKVVCSLIRGFSHTGTRSSVMALAGGPLKEELHSLGADVIIRPLNRAATPLWLLQTARELKCRSVDLLHTHLFTTDVLGRLAGRMAGVPGVTTLHAPSTWKRSYRIKDRTKHHADRFTARYACDALVAISEEVKAFQVKVGGLPASKLHVIGNPVHTAMYGKDPVIRSRVRNLFGIQDNDIVILNVAGLKPIKGQEYLLQAFASLAQRRRLKLLLAGDGKSRTRLETLRWSLGISENVTFCGARDDVPDILAAADVFVMSSLSEGISMAILEAMATGLPTVATAVGGNTDLIRHMQTGILAEPRDLASLAEGIAFILDNPAEACAMGRRAAQFVRERYDAPLIARKYENLYRSILCSTHNGC